MSQNTITLLTQAAELRAVGHTWDAIARRVNRKARTVQKWPTRFSYEWAKVYRAVQLRHFEETSNEARAHLRALMRDDDKRVKHKAIELWTKCAAAVYGKDGTFVVPAPPAGEHVQTPEVVFEMFNDNNRQIEFMKKKIAQERERLGLPPMTDNQLNYEWFFRETERQLGRRIPRSDEEKALWPNGRENEMKDEEEAPTSFAAANLAPVVAMLVLALGTWLALRPGVKPQAADWSKHDARVMVAVPPPDDTFQRCRGPDLNVNRCLGAATLVSILTAPAMAEPGDEFFEKKIRPVLVEQCLKCHSAEAEKAKKLKGGLLLDNRVGMLRGGDSGPAIVPKKSADSLLIKALKYTGDTQMPPAGKLPDAVIADFEAWVTMGAPDPRTGAGPRKQVGLSLDEGRKFWSFKPVQNPRPPAVKDSAWPAGDIDRFILAGLEAKGFRPAADADRATLARRIYFDLTGLPPTPEQIDAFVGDTNSKALEHLVDRLLASPEFGERWGRHWLDVARFGESLTLRGFILKEAWRYRDYVIDTFNSDRPFNQFIREQIAGDLLPATTIEDRRRQLIATAFLALGNTNLEEQDKVQLRMDVVDEQLDVIIKGFLAQTVTCARCHDHKFDPIPTADYYALAGILRNAKAMEHANVSNWIEMPLPGSPEEEAVYQKSDAAVAALQKQIAAAKAKAGPTVAKVIAVSEVPGIVVDDEHAKKVGEWQHSKYSGHFIGDGYIHDQNAGKGEKTLTFQPDLPMAGKFEVRLAYDAGANRADNVPVTVFSADGEKTIHVDMKKTPPIDGRFVSLGEYRVEKNGQGYVIIATDGTKGHVTADAVTFIPVDRPAAKREPDGVKSADMVKALEAELKRLQDAAPHRPMTMTVVEEAKIEDAYIHVRGSVHNHGAVTPRGFLQVCPTAHTPKPSATQSGRKELAEWIVGADNPLTARVIVNRTWHWLFGSGIVRTTDNFGTTGELPSHPELLDHLASRFVADGWSMKQLVRSIVLSRTYRQAGSNATAEKADPENRLVGRYGRKRLEAECIRDAILTVSGKLSRERGGPTFPVSLVADYGFKANDNRRSVYLPVFRNALPEALEVFDFADPSMVTGRRNTSTVAPQALFLLNHPFPAEQAKAAAERLRAEKLPDGGARITRAYWQTLGRAPSTGERAATMKFLSTNDSDPWPAVFHALFASADFRYVD
ncbi:MAG TPA: DUF1553 domain-containing protein [Gemmataceae bacterium]|jgi:cytochrome c553|nr:DUF1553 domain-containing protein [Gemmataceae bacterium]